MLIDIAGVRKHYGALRPLRVNALQVAPGQRLTVRGLDAQAAEMLSLLITGAALPDEGVVTIAGRDTRDIDTDTDWLVSLDVFGLVTARAVLLETLTLEANLALPFTLSIDPVPEEIRRTVADLADEVGLGRERLSASVHSLSVADRVRVHLARALAASPQVLLLEHISAPLTPSDATALGHSLAAIADERRLAWIAITEDPTFIAALGSPVWKLEAASGEVAPVPGGTAGGITTW
ncbi:MAG: ATP-binding cassette domain-containing protein [Acidobacteria bacterium]|nr:ATP-binding cassette domain-containing protein [Acidobacteriota bacterium]